MQSFRYTISILFFSCLISTSFVPQSGLGLSWAKAKTEKAGKSKKAKAEKTEAKSEPHHLTLKAKSDFDFKTPKAIRPEVDFWIMVYTKYDKNFEIFHDIEHLNVVYSVLDFTQLYEELADDREARKTQLQEKLAAEEERIIALLKSVNEKQAKPETMNAEEKRIFAMFKGDADPGRFLAAADPKRIRAQTGIKNKFQEAIENSGAYIEEFEQVFKSYGVPVELTRLAFVESMFNPHAFSKVGASGMWQFMPDTARLFGLTIDGQVDERNDPILAAHAAARLLKANREALGTWYLAMNAYNSGRTTLKNAVSATGGTDIVKIIQNYRGGVYGFASRNFVPSFWAVMEITQDYPKYFGKISPKPKLAYESYSLTHALTCSALASRAQIDKEQLFELNPQLGEAIRNDLKPIPLNYPIRVPPGSTARLAQPPVKELAKQ